MGAGVGRSNRPAPTNLLNKLRGFRGLPVSRSGGRDCDARDPTRRVHGGLHRSDYRLQDGSTAGRGSAVILRYPHSVKLPTTVASKSSSLPNGAGWPNHNPVKPHSVHECPSPADRIPRGMQKEDSDGSSPTSSDRCRLLGRSGRKRLLPRLFRWRITYRPAGIPLLFGLESFYRATART